MLLYHFPLTSNSATPNLTNKGLRNDYTTRNTATFVSGGKLSSYALSTVANVNGLQFEFPNFNTNYSLCLRIYINSNQYLCEINGMQIASSYIGITSNWCDIILQYGKLYVNGAFKRNITYTDGKLLIGGVFSNGGTCNCRIQDIRIYSHILTPQEIADYSKALVLHYPLNGSVKDCSGFGNDITASGSMEFEYVSNSPRYTKQADFSGDKNQYKVGELLGCMTNNFTFSCWFTARQLGTQQYIFSQGRDWIGASNDNYGFNVGMLSNKNLYIGIGGTIMIVFTPTENNTYHIAVTYNNNVCKCYINGELTKTQNITLAPEYKESNTPNAFCVGKISFGYNNSINGYYPSFCKESDIRIYASALSQADIQALYKTPITLGNSLNAYEFIETNEQNIKLYKSGVITANEISENTSNQWSKNGILTTELKEI